MSEGADQESKTEQPTAKRLSEAFEKGQFAKSHDVDIAFGLAAAFCAVLFVVPGVAAHVMAVSAAILSHIGQIELTLSGLTAWIQLSAAFLGRLIFPIVAVSMIAGVVAGGLQSGFGLSTGVIQFSFGKLDPIKGLEKVFSSAVLVQFGIDLLKLIALCAVLYGAVQRVLDDPVFYTPVAPAHVGEFISDTTLYILVRVTVWCAVIAVVSYVYQWRRTRKSQKMTRDEVKQERKSAEVDPKIKNAQRAFARKLMQRQMLGAVPTADVVVTNPTHFAVALKYERGRDRAPVVLAKGRGAFARRIKEIALKNEVPMVENRPVARALFKYGQVGREIPAQLYQVVAEILGFVYRTHRYYFHRLKARRLGHLA